MPKPPDVQTTRLPRSLMATGPGDLHAQARALRQAALAGQAQPLLKGKKLGLLCEDPVAADALRFRRAADGLGAQVAHIRPSLAHLSTPQQVQHTARMLGRLYDAVECQGMAAELVGQLAQYTDVPVFNALAGLPGLPDDLPDDLQEDPQPFVLQALLLHALT